MKFIDSLENNMLIVTENCYRKSILKELDSVSKILNINFISKSEFIKRFYFDYDERAVYYLMDKYNYKEDIARIYLNNIIYVSDRKYDFDKLNLLVSIKNELMEEELLIYDHLFLEYIKNKKVVFYNYNYFNKFDKNMIDEISKITDVSIYDKEYRNFNHDVYEFDTMEEEVNFICTSIMKLIDDGVSPSLIKLTNINDDYVDVIDSLFSMYGLRLDNNSNYLISNRIANLFLELDGSITDRIAILVDMYKNNEIVNKIISVVNKYISFDNMDVVLEMIRNEFKRTKICSVKYNNAIEIIDFMNYPIVDDMYVFLPGFNQNSVPIIYKDEDYITDNMKDDLLLDLVYDKNKLEKSVTISNIRNISNLIISYKNSSSFGTFYPSNLINDMNLSVIKGYKCDTIYSPLYAKFLLAKGLDNYSLYGTLDEDVSRLYSTFDIPYNKYNNKFKGIDKNTFLGTVSEGFNLSYSSMNDYYKCSFKYYLSNILKLNIYEDSFATYIGSLFHYVLEKGLQSEEDADYYVNKFISMDDRELSKKEKFFVEKLIPDISFALSIIRDNLNNTDLKNMLFEERVEVKKQGDVTVTFKGFIDKVMYKEYDNHMIVCIVDYKTGFTDIDLKYVPFGLSMQLPIYLYLAKNSSKLSNIKFAGFYLERVLNSIPLIDKKKSFEDLKKEGLLLYGYSNSDPDILERFDNTYKNSTMIKSMKLDSKGEFSRYSKILSSEKIDKLIGVVDSKIDEAVLSICNAKFDINPKVTEKENLGCNYCKYKDICFKEVRDEILIVPDSDLSFLGGDIDA